jgi:MoaA/NifB/PqqE/SkfB family radical SAM enzyme
VSEPSSGALALLARLEAESGRPLRAMLELSDRCNEVCVHCYQVQGQKGELTTSDWRRVMDELAEAGVLMLTLSGGEVTLRKDFLELVAYARSRGFALRVFTNGLTMTEALARELARHSVMDVEISVYGTRADIHDFVTGVPGSFERTVAGVSALVRAGVCVTIKSVALSVNHDDLAHYAAFAEALGAQHRIDTGGVMAREDGDRCTEALQPPDAALTQLERAHGAMHEVQGGHVGHVGNDAPSGRMPEDELLCGAAHELHFEANGEVRPCTMLDVRLGNADDTAGSSVLSAYGSEAARGGSATSRATARAATRRRSRRPETRSVRIRALARAHAVSTRHSTLIFGS